MVYFNIRSKKQNLELVNLKCIAYAQPIPLSLIENCMTGEKRQELIYLCILICLVHFSLGTTHEIFKPSQLGSATLASALTPDEALTVFAELQRARKSFVLENELHIIYQVGSVMI